MILSNKTKIVGFLFTLVILIWLSYGIYHNLNKPTNRYEFTLQGVNNSVVKLSDFSDKIVLIYFGFLTCPDICPTTLYKIESTFKRLTQEQLDTMQVIYISVDPQRDTPEDIEQHVAYFLPKDKVVGVTGELKVLEQIATNYGADFIKTFPKDYSDLEYLIAHTTALFLFNKQGKFYKRIPYMEPEYLLYQSITEINPI